MQSAENPIPFNPKTMTVAELLLVADLVRGLVAVADTAEPGEKGDAFVGSTVRQSFDALRRDLARKRA